MSNPGDVGWSSLLGDRLVIVGVGDKFLEHLLDTGKQAFKLGGADCLQDMCLP
jgi:hypothetical protein